MGEVVNLRQVRKRREQAAKQTQAAENRIKHGQTKAEYMLRKAEQEAARQRLEAHKRDQTD